MKLDTNCDMNLSEASFEYALELLDIDIEDEVTKLYITVHPDNIFEAGRVSRWVSHFKNIDVYVETNKAFSANDWSVRYRSKIVSSGT